MRPVDQFDLLNRCINYFHLAREFDFLAIPGYGRAEYIIFLILARLLKKKTILFAESWYVSNSLIDYLKGIFLRLFADSLFVSGSRAATHFTNRLKISTNRVYKGYSTVDNEHFNNKINKSEVETSVKSPYLLCVARYSPEKNLVMLIEAFAKSLLYQNWQLVLMGDGPQKQMLVHLVKGKDENIKLIGWKQYDELPWWYQNAEYTILPSVFEPWGLVVNESLAAGTPVLASEACGCVPDLIPDNALIFDPHNIQELIAVLNSLEDRNVQPVKIDIDCKTWAQTVSIILTEV
ncbi:MAG: glycosyltransferase family 4 protein [Bacteroidota bacterium]